MDAIRIPHAGHRLVAGICGLAAAALLLLATTARAADRIYWGNDFGNQISYANLDGSGGGGNVNTSGATVDGPMGLAIDSGAGRIYWTNWGSVNPDDTGTGTKISWANLDGSGAGDVSFSGSATVAGPHGIAIDPAAGKLYWANVNNDTIDVSNLNGSGSAVLNTSGATVSQPRGLAIYPATGRIYWANWANGTGTTISYASLDGSGGGNLMTSAVTVDGPEGVAIDPLANRIYWGNFSNQDTISYVSLSGGSAQNLNTSGATVDNAHGVAIDPIAGRIYWPNFYANVLSWANLDGSGGGNFTPDSLLGADVDAPDLPVILRAPSAIAAPGVSGGTTPGSTLSCSQGSWAADIIAALFYRAPHTYAFQWSRNGTDIPGATGATVAAVSSGDYRCRVIAANAAGSAAQTSPAHAVSASTPTPMPPIYTGSPSNVFRIGRLIRDEIAGTALLRVGVPGPGILSFSDRMASGPNARRPMRKIAIESVQGPRKVKLPIHARGRAKRELNRSGSVRIRVKIRFTPTGGKRRTRIRVVELKIAPRRSA